MTLSIAVRPNRERHYVTAEDARRTACGIWIGTETWRLERGFLLANGVDPTSCATCYDAIGLVVDQVELVVERANVYVRSSRGRDLERADRMLGQMTYARRVERTMIRWALRQMSKLGRRFVIVRPPVVEAAETLDDFVMNRRTWRATVPVVWPPAGVLEGVDRYELAAGVDVLSVPVLAEATQHVPLTAAGVEVAHRLAGADRAGSESIAP